MLLHLTHTITVLTTTAQYTLPQPTYLAAGAMLAALTDGPALVRVLASAGVAVDLAVTTVVASEDGFQAAPDHSATREPVVAARWFNSPWCARAPAAHPSPTAG